MAEQGSQPSYLGSGGKRVTVPGLLKMKQAGEKISMLTAYDFQWANILDEAGIDAILVGDTMGMVVQGHGSTLKVTLDEMIYHAEMVARAVKRALVVVDMPFMTYHVSSEQAVINAGRILKETEASAIKLEGGESQAATIERLTRSEIPVMAHVGMKPQSVRHLGTMSKIQRDRDQLLADAKAAEDAGAFAIVLELIPRDIAAEITAELSIPTIGIGAGPHCDGQVLVTNDMLGLNSGFHPRFLRKYVDLRTATTSAVQQYIGEVRNGQFPAEDHSHD